MPRPAEDFLQALAEFIRHDHFLIHLENLYPDVNNRREFTRDIRAAYAEVARTGVLEYGHIWMANSALNRGATESGAALLIAGAEGTPASVENVSRVVQSLHSGEYRNLPPAIVAQIDAMLAEEDFKFFRRRPLPVELTGSHPVYLFDTMLTRDALFDEKGERVTQLTCLVSGQGEGGILALPPAVINWVAGRPHPSSALDRSHHGQSSIKPSVPARPGTGGDSIVLSDGKPVDGAKGMTASQLAAAIASGGRFVRFQKAFSFVILTSFSTTPAIYLPGGNSGAGPAWQNSLFTMLFGWWGIPWGPIRSIQALITNAKGGIDVTGDVLLQNLGAEGTRRAQAFRPTAKPPVGAGFWALRFAIVAPFLLFALLVFAIVRGIGDTDQRQKAMPGYTEFAKAESALRKGQSGFAPAGKELATKVQAHFSQALEKSNVRLPGDSASAGFHAHMNGNDVIVLVRFSNWRKWGEESQKLAAETLWSSTQSVVAASPFAGEKDLRIHLGIQGLANWVSLAEGGVTGDPSSVNPKPKDEDLIPLFARKPDSKP
jgi:hypothetical protein